MKRETSIQNTPAMQPQSDEEIARMAQRLWSCIDKKALEMVPFSVSQDLNCLPMFLHEKPFKSISVLSDRISSKLNDSLRFLTGYEVSVEKINRKLLQKTRLLAYCRMLNLVEETIIDARPTTHRALLEALLDYSASWGSSDLHVEPSKDGYLIRLRRFGKIQRVNIPKISKEQGVNFIRHIKVRCGLKSTPPDAVFEGSFSHQKHFPLRVRVSTMMTTAGEKCALRLLEKSSEQLHLEELGLRGAQIDLLKTALNRKQGLILICGSTGSGKSTSLASFLEITDPKNRHVISVEDPCERKIHGVQQIEVGKNYIPETLTTLLRQDPDVIAVGEIRESKSANLVLQASISGHLVIATLHASSAKSALERMQGLGIPPSALEAAECIFVSQLLLSRLCPECRIKSECTKKDADLLGIPRETTVWQRGKGSCCGHWGSSGFIGAFDVNSTRSILNNSESSKHRLHLQLIRLLKEGQVSLKDALSACKYGFVEDHQKLFLPLQRP